VSELLGCMAPTAARHELALTHAHEAVQL